MLQNKLNNLNLVYSIYHKIKNAKAATMAVSLVLVEIADE